MFNVTNKTKIIAVAIHKGGSGKTQTALEMATFQAKLGKKVLVVDTDSQANLTDILLNGTTCKGRRLPDIIIENRGIDAQDIMTRTLCGANIDFICNNANAARIESKLPSNGSPKEYILVDLIQPLREHYDIIIIDTPPAAELLSMSSLLLADYVIITALADALSLAGTESTMRLINVIQNNPRLNPNLKILGIIIGRYHNTKINAYYLQTFQQNYRGLVLDPRVRECTKVQQAVKAKCPVILYDPKCIAAIDFKSVFSNLKL